MSISNSKYYNRIIKVVIGGLLLFLLVAFYKFSILSKGQIFALYLVFIAYFEFLFLFSIFLGLFRKLENFYTYLVLISPLVLTFVVTYSSSNNYNLDIQTSVVFSIFFYFFSFILTKNLADFSFRYVNRMFLRKDTSECLGDNYRCISIYTENRDQLPFIKNIIKNVLGYSDEMVKTLVLNETEYEIFEFDRKSSRSLINHLILIPIVQIIDEDDRLCVDEELSIDEGFYNGFFIYQYYEDSDRLYQGTSFDDVYLAFANILTDHDKRIYFDENDIPVFDTSIHEIKVSDSFTLLHKYIVTYDKRDDKASAELLHLRDELCQAYLDGKYKPVIDLICDVFSSLLKKKHVRTVLCLVLVVLISFGVVHRIYAYTNDLMQTITVTFAIPAGLYSMVALYDRFFRK